jgi:hypothetical protein
MKRSERVYKRLAQAFPHEFKLAHGDEMLETGEAAMEYLGRRRGWTGIARLLADAAVRLPIEYLTEMRRDLQYAYALSSSRRDSHSLESSRWVSRSG